MRVIDVLIKWWKNLLEIDPWNGDEICVEENESVTRHSARRIEKFVYILFRGISDGLFRVRARAFESPSRVE